MCYCLFAFCVVLASAAPGWSSELIAPASTRLVREGTQEVPDFQRHVVPLLGRLGCNGRACHGSFQGRGGFRLSLFGYDLKMDHEALTQGTGDYDQVRVNLDDPEASLILLKATNEEEHGGGQRTEPGSWEYRLLDRWIRGGAKGTEAAQRLERLEVVPSQIVFQRPGRSTSIRVVAQWAGGDREDVTCLCRFRTNNDAIAQIDSDGRVTATGKGDTHVVAFYDNGIAVAEVITPVSGLVGPKYPDVPTPTRIDELVVSKLRKLGIVPSPRCSDAEFLRRVSLDITGTLPTAEEVDAFLADPSPDKRAAKIDELLERPDYAAWWATQFCDLTGNNPQNMGESLFRNEQSAQWYAWIYQRIQDNVPYDELVAGIMLAVGREGGESYDQYARQMSSYVRKGHLADFASRRTLPHYWARRTFRTPDVRAIGVAYAFLGIRLQCARCHKHPFDRWTQSDFQQFSRFFAGVTYGVSSESRRDYNRMIDQLGLRGKNGGEMRRTVVRLVAQGQTVPFRELFVVSPRRPNPRARQRRPNNRPATARLLGGDVVDLTQCADPRQPVMQWLRRKDNPYFARALVNRIWAHYFHAGIVDPPDDLNLANPPSNRQLLDYLAHGFVQHGYDLKWLHREITNSRTYQLSWKPNPTNRHDRRNFSRAIPRRLPAEVAYDGLVQATASSSKLALLAQNPLARTISHASLRGPTRYAMQVFGKPKRETTCDCERSDEPTLLQSVYLQNDRDVLAMIDRGGWLTQVARQLGQPPTTARTVELDRLIRQLYLRTVSRPPSSDELQASRQHLAQSESPIAGMRDLLWALLNTKEFLVNH